MPPRRSTRSTKRVQSFADPHSDDEVLVLSDSSDAPKAKAKRTPATRKKAAPPVRKKAQKQREDESSDVEIVDAGDGGEGEDADEALARKLQEEEDIAGELTIASTSASIAAASTSSPRRTTRRSSLSSSVAASTSAAAAVEPEKQEPEQDDPTDPRVVVREFEKLLSGKGVCKCGAEVEGQEGISLTPTTTLDSLLSLASATCPFCAAKLCKGCWSPLPNDEGRDSGECCAESRAVVVFELLAALDKVYLTDHLAKPAAPAPTAGKGKGKKASPAKKKAKIASGAGTGYGSGAGAASYSAYAYGGYGGYGVPSNGTGYSYDDGEYDSEADYEMYGDSEEDREVFDEEMLDHLIGCGIEPDTEEYEQRFEGWRKSRVEAREKRRQEREAARARADATPPVNAHDASQDQLYLRALTLLRPLLPSPDAPTAQIYDFLPHPSLAALLELSTLPDLLALLLRNDSVPEWQRRSEVYFAMLGVLEGLGGSEATLSALFGRRREKKWSEGVGAFVRREGEVKWERKTMVREVQVEMPPAAKGRGRKRKAVTETEVVEGEVIRGVPLFTLLRKLSTQAEAFRKAASTGSFGDGGASDAALIGICGDFSSAGERCALLAGVWEAKQGREGLLEPSPVAAGAAEEEGGPSGKGKGKGKGKARDWSEKDYETACDKLAYKVVDMAVDGPSGGKTFPTHYYRRDIEATANHRRPHKGFVHLAKELAVLSTSLPPGIWVRVDEARVDVLKVLIAGPTDSPYAGGLFEFDIFVPLEYPNKSPSCWLRTTGNNKCRYNPNLYDSGKVCLSLLGTWSGTPEEMWQPGKSTILQVLLSITSMILGTNFPFYNEPGFGAPKDDIRNKNYNKNCSLATTRWAILNWIEGDTFKDSIWSDVIVSHFLLNRSTISSTIAGWAKADDRMKKWTASLNATAGTDRLEPYSYARYTAAYAGIPAPGVSAAQAATGLGAAVAAKGKGKGKAAAAVAEEPKKPADPPSRDLVKEVEAALDKLEGWREAGWLETLVSA
ncbi:hypothetical protein JCM10213_005346 [Rhodosporidiobolus nylandii]